MTQNPHFYKYLLMFGLFTWLFNACKQFTGGYIKEDGMVYWTGGVMSAKKQALPDADPKTFEELDLQYGKDKQKAFFQSRKIDNAHVPTFAVLLNGYAKDQQTAYFEGFAIQGSDPATFQLTNFKEVNGALYTFAKDKNHAYYKHIVLSNEPNNFEVLSAVNEVYRDNKQVYFKNRSLQNADAPTFQAIKPATYQYNNRYYIPYFKDKNRVYYSNGDLIMDIEGANPATFALISPSNNARMYAKDDKFLYCNGIAVSDADIATLEILPQKDFFSDKNYYYLHQSYGSDYSQVLRVKRNTHLPNDLALMDSLLGHFFVSAENVEKIAYQLAQKNMPNGRAIIPSVLCLPTELATYQNIGSDIKPSAWYEEHKSTYCIYMEMEWDATELPHNDTNTLKTYLRQIINAPELRQIYPHSNISIIVKRKNLDYSSTDRVFVKPEFAQQTALVRDDMIELQNLELMYKK